MAALAATRCGLIRWATACVVFLGVSALFTGADAQELRGSVTLADSTTPAAGVIVEARIESSGEMVGQTLTSGAGYFFLRLPPGVRVALRGLRIGQRPSELGSITLEAGETRVARFALSGAAVLLDRVRVVEEPPCGALRSDARQVAMLFDEARKALRATSLATSSGVLVAEWVRENHLVTLRGDPLTEPTVQLFQATTNRPFTSLSPDSLGKVGYLSKEGESWVYQAPDADVLLSDSFVRGHCFRAVPSPTATEDLVGVAFEPTPRRGRRVVGVRGTIWIDRVSAELRRLDFDYVNVPRELADTPAGGRVEFRRLLTGDWFVDRWTIRMPRPTMEVEATYSAGRFSSTGARRTMRVSSMEVASGRVREVRRGAAVIFSMRDEEEVPGRGRLQAEAVASLCTADVGADHGVVWGTVRDSSGTRLPGVTVSVAWEHSRRFFGQGVQTSETGGAAAITGADGFWFACGVPRGSVSRATAATGASRGRPTDFLIPSDALGAEIVVTVQSVRRSGSAASVRGFVFDSLRTAGPWAGAEVWILGTFQHATSDSLGRFEIANVDPGLYMLGIRDGSLDFLNVPPPTVAVIVAPGDVAPPVLLATPSVSTMIQRLCGGEVGADEGVLIGEVRDLAGARRSGVRVSAEWSRLLLAPGVAERENARVESISSRSGSFALCGVPLSGSLAQQGGAAALLTGEFRVRAESSGVDGGPLTLQLGGEGLVRRDLIVGDSRRQRVGGRVLDLLGRPIADATVMIVGSDAKAARTDSAGAWTIDAVTVRSTEIVVRALRYLPRRHVVDPVSGRLTVGELRLERAPQLLATTTIRGTASETRAAFEFRRASGVGTFLDDDWLKRFPAVTVTTVRTAIAKTRLVVDPSEGMFGSRYKLAFETDLDASSDRNLGIMETCFPRWYVDGVDFGIPTAAEEGDLIRQAKRIEAYRVMEMPPRYTDFDGCGVILIWTYALN